MLNIEELTSFLTRHGPQTERFELRQKTLSGGSMRVDLWRSGFEDPPALCETVVRAAQRDVENQRGKIQYYVEAIDNQGATLGRSAMVLEGRADVEMGETTTTALGDPAAMLAARETFIRTLLDSLLSSSQKYAADNRDLVKLVLDSHRQVTSELQELHKMVRESTLRREDADITRMTIELERIRLQGEQKEQEFQHMLKLDQNERGMNALEALISNPLAKSAPMPVLKRFVGSLTPEQVGTIVTTLTPEQQITFNAIHEALSPEPEPAAPAPTQEKAS